MQSRILRICLYVLLSIIGLMMIGPFVWMLLTSFKTLPEAVAFPPTFLPEEWTVSNFAEIFNKLSFARYFFNTSIVAFSRTFSQLFIGSMAAFAFAKIKFPGRDPLFLTYISTMMIPAYVVLIPSFLIVRSLGWMDTFIGLIIPPIFSGGLVFGIFIMRQFYMTIPDELMDAANIDGCSYGQTYAKIIVPLSKPVFSTFGILTFVWAWNDLLWPLIITSAPEQRVLAVGLALFQGMFGAEYHLAMAAAVVANIPLVLLFIFGQKHIVEGIALTGMGGR